jgi:hypothetical protein
MIRLRTALRVMPAFWLALPLIAFAAWYVTLLYPSDGYALDAATKASMTIAFVGAICAACAAWEGSRLRRAGVWQAPSVRSRWSIALWHVLPIVAVGLSAIIAAMLIQAARSQAGPPDARIVLMTLLDLVSYSAAGFALGLVMRFAVAGPLALIATFVWIGFVPAIEPVWLRHLTGMFRDCCGLAQDLAWPPVIASTLLDAAIISAAAAAVAGSRLTWLRVGAGVAVLVVAFNAGSSLVEGMTYLPAVARDATLLNCDSDHGVTLCTWPEHRARAAEIGAVAAEVRSVWLDAGMSSPSTFTEADPTVAPSDALAFQIDGNTATRDNMISSFAQGMLPSWPACPSPIPGVAAGSTGGSAFPYLQAWYEASGGMTEAALQASYGGALSEPDYPAPLDVVAQLWHVGPEARRDWIKRTERATQQCDSWDPALIAVTP